MALMFICGVVGGIAFFLAVASVVGVNWPVMFWIGAMIAIFGAAAGLKRETKEFSDAKFRI